MTRNPLVPFVSLLLVACSAAGLEDASPGDTDVSDTDQVKDTGDTGVIPTLEGDWLGVSGALQIVGGLPAEGGELQLEVHVTDADGVLSTVGCGATLVGPAEPLAQADDEVALYGNWRFTVQPGTCTGLPDSLEIGIGPLVPALWPSAEQAGASLKHTRGVYTPNAGRTGLLVFGMAGTPAQIAGQGTPASLDPLPDGRYHFLSAYLLAL